MTELNRNDITQIMSSFKQMADENKDYFIKLDSVMGDSDLGLTMQAVFTAANIHVSNSDEADLGKLMMQAGMEMSKAAPSTMGTLMATGFMRGGKAIKGALALDLHQFSAFWRAFVDGIMERGKTKPGNKTIVDALYPAALSLDASVKNGVGMAEAFAAAAVAAHEGVSETKNMVAQHGRAAYHGENSRQAQDPGATVGALLMDNVAQYLNQ